jgi:tetratricopeptide (TPR) repeat protein
MIRVALTIVLSLALVPARGAPAPDHPHIVLLGLDAADWLAIDPLVAAGKLPGFARLKALGRTGVMLSTPPLISPMIWTTIATGVEPENHGVLDFMVDLPDGGQAPVGSSQRLAPAVWNIFSAAGRRVAVVGWWATWPAERVRGTIVSDAVAPQLTRQSLRSTADLVSPADASRRILGRVTSIEALTRQDLAAYVPLTDQAYAAARAAETGSGVYDNSLAHLAAVIAGTRTYAAIAEDLARTDAPELLAVYFESIDTVSHLFVRDAHAHGGRGAIDRVYQDADAVLRRLAEASAPDTLIIVCSDHGFYPPSAAIAEDPANLAGPATAWHRPYGIFGVVTAGALMSGQPSPRSPAAGDGGIVTPIDVAPTLLHAAGLAVPSDMPGRVAASFLPPEAASRAPVRNAPLAYTPPAPSARADGGEILNRLRALGYIGAAKTSLARQNLAESLFRRGKFAAAERELRALLESQPRNVAAHLWLAQTLARTNRAREAVTVYERAVALPGGARDALVEAVDLAISTGMIEAAQRMIAGAGSTAPYARVARGALLEAQRDSRSAEREWRAALAAEPTSFDAASRWFDLLVRGGRAREALEPVERAARLAPDAPRLVALSGTARLAAGDAAGAERAFRRALELAPDADAVRLGLGRALLKQGKTVEAIDTLGRAAETLDRDVLLGAAYSSGGDWVRAVEHLQRALDGGRATPEVLNSLGWAHLQLGHRREAAALFTRSLTANSNQPEIRRILRELGGVPEHP